MELTLKGKNLDFAKKGIFKAKYNLQFLFYKISSLEITSSQGFTYIVK